MKNLLLIILIYSVAFCTSCHKHEEEDGAYIVTITINKPTPNQSISKNTPIPIDLTVTRAENKVIHHLIVELFNPSGQLINTIINKHYHEEGTVSYSNNNILAPAFAGTYMLKVTSTDDAEGQPNTKEVNFTIN